MLLGNKKNQENDHNWCLVLNTLHNEIDKKKVAGKISEVFSLSQEEAIDLVSNTPIILLDNLNRPTAVQAKDYFRPTGAEIFLTNDIFLKRKCYRTVWPEPPNLTFLQRLEESPKRDEPQERLAPQEAVHALRSQDIKETKEDRPLAEAEKKMTLPMSDKGAARDINRLKEEVGTWRRKFEAQSQELEKLRKEYASRERVVSSSDSVMREREKEIQKQKALLANAEEKYEGLKEEYRHARALFEEKFGVLNKEAQEGKKKGEHLVKENEKLEQLRKSLEQELNQRTQRFEGTDEEFRQIRTLLETKLKEAGQEMDAWKSKSEEMNKKIQALDHEREQLGQKISQQIKENESWRQKYQEAADQLVALQSGRDHEKIYFEKEKEKLDQLHKHKEAVEKSLAEESEKAGRLEQQLASTLQEIEEWKTRADEMAGKLWNFEQSEKDLNKILREKEDSLRTKIEARQKEHETVLNQKLEEINDWKSRCEELMSKVSSLEAELNEERPLRENAQNQERNTAEALKIKQAEAEDWRNRAEELKTRYHALEIAHKQEKTVRAKAEERLKELEQGKLVFEQTLNQVQRSYEVLQEQYRKEQIRAEDQASQAAKAVEDWKVRLAEMSGQVDRLAQEKAALEEKMNEQAKEIHAGHETHKTLTEKIQAVRIACDQEIVLKEKAVAELQGVRQTFQTLEKLLRDEQSKSTNLEKEKHEIRLSLQQKLEEAQHEAQGLKTKEEEFKGKIQAFEKNQLQLIQELEERAKKLRQGEVKILDMEKALRELSDSSQNLEKMFQANLKQLEGKEKDLELSRKQIRELNLQLEQRELIFKRTQLTNQLIEKENQLKGLVKEQERIEFEIRDREETLRKVLSEQENVEKDIIEGKQAQRHYLEQAKKEKSRFKGGRSDEDISETEFPSQEAHSVEND